MFSNVRLKYRQFNNVISKSADYKVVRMDNSPNDNNIVVYIAFIMPVISEALNK